MEVEEVDLGVKIEGEDIKEENLFEDLYEIKEENKSIDINRSEIFDSSSNIESEDESINKYFQPIKLEKIVDKNIIALSRNEEAENEDDELDNLTNDILTSNNSEGLYDDKMAARSFASMFIVLALATNVGTQFFDFFDGFQSYIPKFVATSRPTTILVRKQPFSYNYYESNYTTRKPVTTTESHRRTTRRNGNKHGSTTKRNVQAHTDNPFDKTRSGLTFSSFVNVPESNDGSKRYFSTPRPTKKQSTTVSNIHTTKPERKIQSSHQQSTSRNKIKNDTKKINDPLPISNINDENVDDDFNHHKNKRKPIYESQEAYHLNDPGYSETTKAPIFFSNGFNQRPNYNYDRPDYDRPQNIFNDYNRPFDAKPNNHRPNNNQGANQSPNYNSGYTQSPVYAHGLVGPAVPENKPPITNRPPQQNWNHPTRRPPDTISFPADTDQSPEMVAGPDEDYMTEVEKRKYVELAERMCDKYKSLNVKQLAAIPLLPSPDRVSVNISNCIPSNVPLVVGGKVVSIQEFPHMALLGWTKLRGGGYSWKCGGSLVSDRFVLTAAHCAYQERDNSVVTGPPRVVQLGSSFLDDPGAIVIKVASAVRHPKYKQPKSYYDLAILKLASRVTFSERIKPACLGAPPAVGEPVIATGWGRTEFGGDQSEALRSVSIPIWDITECWRVLGTSRKLPNGPSADSQICAGEMRGGKDTCQGDSGGPVQTQDGCVWRVAGVTSLGRSCGAPRTPGLYALTQPAFISAVVFGGR